MELGPRPGADAAAPRGHGLHPRACSASRRFVSTSPHLGRMNLLSGAPISLDPDVIRAGTSMDQVIANAIGDQTADPEPRARRRAQRAAARGRAVDDLRLEPVVGLAEQAGDQGDLPVARLRSPRRRRHRPRPRSQHPRRGAGRSRRASSRASAATTTTSWTSTSRASATSRSGSSAPAKEERLEGWRPTLDTAGHAAAEERAAAGRARIT